MTAQNFNTTEEWFDIPSFQGVYQLSNLGRVKRLAGSYKCNRDRLMKIIPDKYGYAMVRLSLKGKPKNTLVHRLIAEVFLPFDKDRPFVNHKDGNKTNNSLDNLEYVTHQENLAHAGRIGLLKNHGKNLGRGSQVLWSKLKENQVIAIKQLLEQGLHVKEIAKKFNIPVGTINSIKYGSTWGHLKI